MAKLRRARFVALTVLLARRRFDADDRCHHERPRPRRWTSHQQPGRPGALRLCAPGPSDGTASGRAQTLRSARSALGPSRAQRRTGRRRERGRLYDCSPGEGRPPGLRRGRGSRSARRAAAQRSESCEPRRAQSRRSRHRVCARVHRPCRTRCELSLSGPGDPPARARPAAFDHACRRARQADLRTAPCHAGLVRRRCRQRSAARRGRATRHLVGGRGTLSGAVDRSTRCP